MVLGGSETEGRMLGKVPVPGRWTGFSTSLDSVRIFWPQSHLLFLLGPNAGWRPELKVMAG